MIEGFVCGTENWVLFGVRFAGIVSIYTRKNKFLGDLSDVGTPGYIPNPVVKDVSADGTWGVTPWESRSLPRDFFLLKT